MSREIDSAKINSAIELATQIHENHKRASGEYYYEHTIRVYKKLVGIGVNDEITLLAAILHQSLDFEEGVGEIIDKEFGNEVLDLIKKYRKLVYKPLGSDTPQHFNEKYIMQAYINMADDVRALVIRLADRVDNLETSLSLDKEKRISIAQKALHFYSPLARLIGMGRLAVMLEDSAFKITNPREYAQMDKIIRKRVKKVYKDVEDLKNALDSLLIEQNVPHKISFRVKHLYGIYRKSSYYTAKGKNSGKYFENIHDVIAMRVIVDNEEHCYLTDQLVKELVEYIPDEWEDYIRKPRHTGYKSLHNSVRLSRDFVLEVQIRTEEMHELAEYGQSSHLLYKIGDKGGEGHQAITKFKSYLKENPYWFKDLNFWEIEKELVEYKPSTPFSKNVYALTPKGDIIELPRGANVIDFAYHVHTRLGDSCIGAFVNGKQVKLEYEIQDGDQVEIKTMKNKTKPSADWIKMVKTSKARACIRKALKM